MAEIVPRFLKVFLSETSFESFSIPQSFMEHLAVPLPPTAKLQGIGGGTWTVSMSIIREVAYFTTGWSNFVEEHNLKSGEFLNFVYDGLRTFEVSVFGRSSCKEIRAVPEVVDLSDSDSEEEEEEEETPMADADADDELASSGDQEMSQSDNTDTTYKEDEEETSMDDAGDELAFSGDQGMSQSVYHLDSDENDTEVFVGNSDLDVTNPCFDTKLKKRIFELLIPADVIKEHHLTFQNKIEYIDEEGVTTGERSKGAPERVCFQGWHRVCRRNKLKKTDTVTCELLHTRKKVHSVRIHITRGTD